ncbi:MAG: hypothetical protein WB762_29885 [Candidatus Sulfotelmatobacter sp.]
MSCVLRASGANFDVDEFLKVSSLDALTAFHRGAVQFLTSSVTRRSDYSGMKISVSAREFSDLNGQVDDAVGFLRENDRELRRLRDFPGLEHMDLEFPVEDRDLVFQRDAFPHQLLSLLGDLRIGLIVSRCPAHWGATNQIPTEQ